MAEEKVEVSHQGAEGRSIQRSPLFSSGGGSFWFGLGKNQWVVPWGGWAESAAAKQGRDSSPFWLFLTFCSEY